MKKIYEICYSNSATVPSPKIAYANEKPFFSQKVVIESETEIDSKAEYDKLRAIIDPLVLEYFNKNKVDEAGLRIRTKDGKRYPSVTSILSPTPYNGNPEYGIRGTEIHKIVNHYAFEGEWIDPKAPLSTLKYEDIKYKEFFEAFKDRISFKAPSLQVEIEFFNDEHMYSGEVDMLCLVDGVLTLCDIKTGQWKWEQLVAYYKGLNDKKIKQLAVFDIKKQKLEVLKVTDEKAKSCWENFLKKRGALEAIFNV